MALNVFSEQSGRAVLLKPELANALTSKGVDGSLEPEIALAEMLQGTGLTYRKTGDTFLIVEGGSSDPQSGSAAGDGADGTVEALIVTAQKREEDIQDVPIAISAFTQEDLTRSQVAGGPDLITQVPNMTFTKTNFTSYSIQLRGIGTQAISATTDPGVAVAFNNTPFIRNRFFEQEFYDLQRVEVLRGPQGTLYGRNATGGAVNLITAKPTASLDGYVRQTIGGPDFLFMTEAAVGGPLTDNIRARIAMRAVRRDGYGINEITGNDIDNARQGSVRAHLEFLPSDRLSVLMTGRSPAEDDRWLAIPFREAYFRSSVFSCAELPRCPAAPPPRLYEMGGGPCRRLRHPLLAAEHPREPETASAPCRLYLDRRGGD
jgi:outer membrane receptor protein involved in Fe transport